jgi:AraC family transcriptional regulator
MLYTVTKIELVRQPVIIGRKRVKRSDIAATIAQVLAHVFQFAQQRGIALTGLPFTRYVEVDPGLVTMEPGMRVANPNHDPVRIDPSWTNSTGEADVRMDTLPGGPAAFTTHLGPYDKLSDAYAAAQEWIEAEGLTPAGPPWESYVTDPSEYPNPADWKTEVYWPVRP